jgi:sulfur carrier protein
MKNELTITLNHRKEIFPNEKMTISEIMESKQFIFKMLVVKLNGKLIKKESYSSTVVNSGDNLEIIHLVSGG